MLHQIHPNKIKQLFFIAILILLAIVIGKEMYFALGAFLGAVTLYVLLRNTFIKWVVNYKWKKWVAALVIIFATIIILVIPITLLLIYGINQVTPLVANPTIITDAFEKIHQYVIEKLNIDILDKSYIAKLNTVVLPLVQNMLGSTASLFTSLAIMFFIFYYMLMQSFEIEMWLKKSMPFKPKNIHLLLNESRNIVYGNAIGIPILAIIQGMVGLIGYWIFGVEKFVLFGLLTAIGSVIPVVGTAIVYVPLAIYLLAIGNTTQGIEVLAWGVIVVGASDNIARFAIAKKVADVHPLITIFGVIIGINIFGFLGIIFGPLLLSVFFLLVKIYVDEFGNDNIQNPT